MTGGCALLYKYNCQSFNCVKLTFNLPVTSCVTYKQSQHERDDDIDKESDEKGTHYIEN